MKTLGWIFACLASLIMLNLMLDGMFPAGLDTKSTQQADALLYAKAGVSDLPDEVEITIDGAHAVFHRGDKSYDQLVALLPNGHSQDMLDATGGQISLSGTICGEMAIRNYGITSHFKIGRSANNKCLYWIRLPHLNRGGYAIPFFTADPRVIDLIKKTAAVPSIAGT